MEKLKKILNELEQATKQEDAPIYCGDMEVDGYVQMSVVEDIIRKHMNDGWISVNERLPEEKINPVSQDLCEYQVTAKFGNLKDVRHYKYGHGHWWHGPGIVDKYVIAWRENPEPYRPEQPETCKYTGGSCCYPIDQCGECPNNPERSENDQ